jgi:haloalkane dehalogenase
MSMTTDRLLAHYRASGRPFMAAGVRSFVLDAGARDAEPVVCVHGVPASAYLYRKVVPALAIRGLRGIAVDLPGLGLAERPADELRLDRFHLLVRDIGGPIGFEVAAADPARVRSLTLLNTIVAVETFRRPWVMEPFAHPGLGEAWLKSVRLPGVFVSLMRYIGVSRDVPAAEISCYVSLLLGDDGGSAFLKIMRGFELTADKQHRYMSAVRNPPYPVQIVWGVRDRALSWRHAQMYGCAHYVDKCGSPLTRWAKFALSSSTRRFVIGCSRHSATGTRAGDVPADPHSPSVV